MNLARRIARSFGYELVRKRKLNDTLEQHLQNVLAQQRINLVIDVGANSGQFAQLLRHGGYAGRIESFEPLEDVFNELKERCDSDPDWNSHQLALGRDNRIAAMQRYAASEFSSMLSLNDFAKKRFKWRAHFERSEDILMTTLSDIWPRITEDRRPPRALLKLDTQGFDLEVLAGAGDSLQKIFAIQVELSLKSIYNGAPRYLDALAEFERRGYEITGMYPVSRDKQALAIIEYDCVLMRHET